MARVAAIVTFFWSLVFVSAAVQPLVISDNDSKLVYSGTWRTGNFPAPWNNPAYSLHGTAGPISSVSFSFRGTALSLHGDFGGTGDSAVVTLDGRRATLDKALGLPSIPIYTITGLDAQTTHTFLLEFNGSGKPGGGGILVDFFEITPVDPTASVASAPPSTAPAAAPSAPAASSGAPLAGSAPPTTSNASASLSVADSAPTPSVTLANGAAPAGDSTAASASGQTAAAAATDASGAPIVSSTGSIGTAPESAGTGTAPGSSVVTGEPATLAAKSSPRAPGAIAGGLIGGAALIGLLAFGAYKLRRARRRRLSPSQLVAFENAMGQRPTFAAHRGATWTDFAPSEAGERGW